MRVPFVTRNRGASKPSDCSNGGALVRGGWPPCHQPHSSMVVTCFFAVIERLNKGIAAKDDLAKESSSDARKSSIQEYHRRFEEVQRVGVATAHPCQTRTLSRSLLLSGIASDFVAAQTRTTGKSTTMAMDAVLTRAPTAQTALLAIPNHKSAKVRRCLSHAFVTTAMRVMQAQGIWLLPTAKEIKGEMTAKAPAHCLSVCSRRSNAARRCGQPGLRRRGFGKRRGWLCVCARVCVMVSARVEAAVFTLAFTWLGAAQASEKKSKKDHQRRTG